MERRLFALVLTAVLPVFASAVSMDMVPVGDPGNAPDPLNTNSIPGIGSVSYTYQIGKFEVQNSEYAEFLNAVAARGDTYGLYNNSMGSDARGGITRTGAGTPLNPYVYSTKPNMGNKPVMYVSMYDAVRFVNWLENGQPIGRQGTNTTEMGSYTLFTDGSSTTNFSARAANATWVIPTENEWYKAAYYDPGPSGPADEYWLYPTRSDNVPTAATATATGDISNPGPNVANYNSQAAWNGQLGNVTTVGSAGPLSASYYGTFDQGGNLFEWSETIIDPSQNFLATRAGDWSFFDGFLESGNQALASYEMEEYYIGFRVAMIPEPRALVAPGLAAMAACVWRRRRR